MTDAGAWDHRHHDDDRRGATAHAWPSPELAGIVAMLGRERGRAIDIGCGSGADAVYLAERGFDVVGLDVSTVALEIAARRSHAAGVDVEWTVGSALELPIADASVEVAFDRGCLHHVAVEDQPRYIAELARVLKVGGRAFLRDVSGHGHHPTPVTGDGMRRLVDGTRLSVTAAVPFQMASSHPPGSATLVVLQRS